MRYLLAIMVPSEKEKSSNSVKSNEDKLSYSEELNMVLQTHFPIRGSAATPLQPLQLHVHGATKSR